MNNIASVQIRHSLFNSYKAALYRNTSRFQIENVKFGAHYCDTQFG